MKNDKICKAMTILRRECLSVDPSCRPIGRLNQFTSILGKQGLKQFQQLYDTRERQREKGVGLVLLDLFCKIKEEESGIFLRESKFCGILRTPILCSLLRHYLMRPVSD